MGQMIVVIVVIAVWLALNGLILVWMSIAKAELPHATPGPATAEKVVPQSERDEMVTALSGA